jgi:hypothetical protein
VKGKRARKWKLWLGIAGGVLVVLVGAGFAGWRALTNFFVRQYYQDSYAPLALAANRIGDYPAEHHLGDIPWIAAELPVCQSTSLQMIAARQGIEQPRPYFDFLMGFTYGATNAPGAGFTPFGTDPEVGFAVAAPYLGLARRYYVTDDETLYLNALRFYLSQGYPVRAGLDMGVLYGAGEQMPHSDVLVGYDESGFYYYETVCIAPASCEPGRRPPGDEGLYVPDERLLGAVLGQARQFSYPWRYSFTIFEEGPQEQDLGPVWMQDGQALVGGAQYGPCQGAAAIEELATSIEERGARFDASDVQFWLEVMATFRQDNATYLRAAFAGERDIERAAELLERASADCQAVTSALERGDGIADQAQADRIARWLRDAAAAEREAGEIFLGRGQ